MNAATCRNYALRRRARAPTRLSTLVAFQTIERTRPFNSDRVTRIVENAPAYVFMDAANRTLCTDRNQYTGANYKLRSI